MRAQGEMARQVLILTILALSGVSAASTEQAKGKPNLPPVVQRALAAELRAAEDKSHPMCYELRRSSPRVTSTKKICETRDGAIALLVALNDQQLSEQDAAKEQSRLSNLLRNPNRQMHRKQTDDQDMQRVLRILRALPDAFLYQPAGIETGPHGPMERFTFVPNPRFDPLSMETLPMTKMKGDLWIDLTRGRIAKLEGSLQDDVNFGWGILGQLDKGGWIRIEQSEVAGSQWRITHFQMEMTGRILIKNKVFSSDQRLTSFKEVSTQLSYQQAIHMLLAVQSEAHVQSHSSP